MFLVSQENVHDVTIFKADLGQSHITNVSGSEQDSFPTPHNSTLGTLGDAWRRFRLPWPLLASSGQRT